MICNYICAIKRIYLVYLVVKFLGKWEIMLVRKMTLPQDLFYKQFWKKKFINIQKNLLIYRNTRKYRKISNKKNINRIEAI